MLSFIEGLKIPLQGLILTRPADRRGEEELSYLPWATAVALAGRPPVTTLTFGGRPYLPVFDGAVVACEANGQVVYLPAEGTDAASLTAALSRCRAKAIALGYGVGLSLYAGFGAEHKEPALAFLKALGVKPDTPDLGMVRPLTLQRRVRNGMVSYIPWAAAFTAAKITDPDFRFTVLTDPETGAPYFPAPVGYHDPKTGDWVMKPAGYLVAVQVTWKGISHTEWLSIHDGARFDFLPQPTVEDWNRAVMRCLVRAIALVTGYGLALYADEDAEDLQRTPLQRKPEPTPQPEDIDAQGRAENTPAPEQVSGDDAGEPVLDPKLVARIQAIADPERLKLAQAHLEQRYQGQVRTQYLKLLAQRAAELGVQA